MSSNMCRTAFLLSVALIGNGCCTTFRHTDTIKDAILSIRSHNNSDYRGTVEFNGNSFRIDVETVVVNGGRYSTWVAELTCTSELYWMLEKPVTWRAICLVNNGMRGVVDHSIEIYYVVMFRVGGYYPLTSRFSDVERAGIVIYNSIADKWYESYITPIGRGSGLDKYARIGDGRKQQWTINKENDSILFREEPVGFEIEVPIDGF